MDTTIHRRFIFAQVFFISVLLLRGNLAGSAAPLSQTTSLEITALDSQGGPITQLTDGDEIHLQASLAAKSTQTQPISFLLNDLAQPLAQCTIAAGEQSCQTESLSTLGWYWNTKSEPQRQRTITAQAGSASASLDLNLSARPVVMVHGFSSDWRAWQAYLGPDGYLASIGVPGYAVGDGQVPGVMNTGKLDQPNGRTNTIAENAAILGQYIAAVKKATAAHKIDLLAHSMGGLIARYYIDRLMPEGEVAQLIMLGSPMAGTACADLPAALDLYLPAALEIQPSYVLGVFNPQITHRHGVPFYALAGDPITEAIKSPCTEVPTDLAVSLPSVTAIPLHVAKMPVLHTELNSSSQVFGEYVKARLQAPPGVLALEPDPPVAAAGLPSIQFTRIYTGHVSPDERRQIVISIEPGIIVASFALFDTSRSLDVEVQGASGNTVALGANNLVRVDDPQALFYLGYGFNNPKPGEWKVNLVPTASTPPAGADYALTASFQGGASLKADTSSLLPAPGQPVTITAKLDLNGESLMLDQASARLRTPDGGHSTISLSLQGNQYQGEFTPDSSGLYSLQVQVLAQSPEGSALERTTSLVIEVQPDDRRSAQRARLVNLVGGAALLLIVVFAGWLIFVFLIRRLQR